MRVQAGYPRLLLEVPLQILELDIDSEMNRDFDLDMMLSAYGQISGRQVDRGKLLYQSNSKTVNTMPPLLRVIPAHINHYHSLQKLYTPRAKPGGSSRLIASFSHHNNSIASTPLDENGGYAAILSRQQQIRNVISMPLYPYQCVCTTLRHFDMSSWYAGSCGVRMLQYCTICVIVVPHSPALMSIHENNWDELMMTNLCKTGLRTVYKTLSISSNRGPLGGDISENDNSIHPTTDTSAPIITSLIPVLKM